MNKSVPAVLVACVLAAARLEAGPVDADVADLFSQGKELFRQANQAAATDPDKALELYRRSAMRFERIVKDGDIHNGKLFYNIGNVYFRMKDVGRAILNYRRAQQYIPNDPNLNQNLEYALVRRLDSIDERQQTRILRTLFFWHYDLSTRVRSTMFGVFFVCFWGVAARRLLVRKAPAGLWSLVVCLVAAGLCVGSLLVDAVAYRTVRPGVITAAEAVARKGDSATYQPSFKEPLHPGTEFRLVETRANWYHIGLSDGRRCWVPTRSAELVR